MTKRLTTLLVTIGLLASLAACNRPQLPSLTGPGKLHDITQIRKGMSPNEVRRVLGSQYKSVFEEGIEGIDGGNFIWEYPEGRVYFNLDGVTRVVPSK
jgi:hypothetical protein